LSRCGSHYLPPPHPPRFPHFSQTTPLSLFVSREILFPPLSSRASSGAEPPFAPPSHGAASSEPNFLSFQRPLIKGPIAALPFRIDFAIINRQMLHHLPMPRSPTTFWKVPARLAEESSPFCVPTEGSNSLPNPTINCWRLRPCRWEQITGANPLPFGETFSEWRSRKPQSSLIFSGWGNLGFGRRDANDLFLCA